MMRPYLILGALVAVLVAAGGGFWSGIRWQQGNDARRLSAAQEAAHKAALARQEAEQRLATKSQQLEDAAHAAPITHPDCLPASRVRRLREYQLPASLRGAGGTP